MSKKKKKKSHVWMYPKIFMTLRITVTAQKRPGWTANASRMKGKKLENGKSPKKREKLQMMR